MSIREETVDLILAALDTIVNVAGADGRRLRVENGIDAILAQYAVVELPEANGGPMGIEWASNGGHVTGRVLAIGDDGQPFEILTITYTVEQAAQMATHLIDAIGGKR